MTDSEIPSVAGLTIGEAFAQTVRRHGDRDAVVFPLLETRWSYAEYFAKSRDVARALLALGVKPGDHVGIWSPNCPEWLLAQYGAALAGAVCINLNPAYQTHDAEFVIGQSDISVLFVYDRFKSTNYEAIAAELVEGLDAVEIGDEIRSAKFPKLRHVVSLKNAPSVSGIWPWNSFREQAACIPEARLSEIAETVSPEQPAILQFTSGSTGTPKGALLSHKSLLLNAYYLGLNFRYTHQDRVCCPVPFFHCFGFVAGSVCCMVFGAALVVPGETFVAEDVMGAIESERCTSIYGVPTMFNAIVHNPRFSTCRFDTLRTGIMGGSPCPIELMKTVTREMHVPEMTIGYGLTEGCACTTVTSFDEELEYRCSTVGRPIPGVDVRLMNPETGKECGEGEQGELETRGHHLMLGYYKCPDATKQILRDDGWLRTGDLAVKNDAGLYQITGRIKDIVIRGGENIYPREIEEFILSHPGVRDVTIVGVPDPHFGEQLFAWVVPSGERPVSRDDIHAYCKHKIAHYKIPHFVEFLESFPLLANGKVQKTALRSMALEKCGLKAKGDG